MDIGKFNTLTVVKEVPFGLYLASDLGEILLPKKYVHEGTKIGDSVKVFIYTDSEDRLIATTLTPLAQVGDFACLDVEHTTDFGAFLSWGLEKQLFVPLSEQHRRMQVGEKHIVRLSLDQRTNRIIGIGKIGTFIEKQHINLQEGEEVDLLVYEMTTLGFMCLINNRYAGILYKNEVFKKLAIGDKTKGFVKKLREDNKIDLSLRKEGFKGIIEDSAIILQQLEAAGGFLPYHDGSSSEEIQQAFQMSKKTFKKLIGNLYKGGFISLAPNGISLKK